MTPEAWVGHFISQADSVVNLWIVYVLVATLIVSYIGQRGRELGEGVNFVLFLVFLGFAIVNGIPIYQSQETLWQIHAELGP